MHRKSFTGQCQLYISAGSQQRILWQKCSENYNCENYNCHRLYYCKCTFSCHNHKLYICLSALYLCENKNHQRFFSSDGHLNFSPLKAVFSIRILPRMFHLFIITHWFSLDFQCSWGGKSLGIQTFSVHTHTWIRSVCNNCYIQICY